MVVGTKHMPLCRIQKILGTTFRLIMAHSVILFLGWTNQGRWDERGF